MLRKVPRGQIDLNIMAGSFIPVFCLSVTPLGNFLNDEGGEWLGPGLEGGCNTLGCGKCDSYYPRPG
jgi:hypothetical protein